MKHFAELKLNIICVYNISLNILSTLLFSDIMTQQNASKHAHIQSAIQNNEYFVKIQKFFVSTAEDTTKH